MDTVTGFTFGYVAAFIYMLIRLHAVEQQLEDYYED
tara:strand:+ start:2767 stop:2874 length:108 start_codon:yes stop_codon:yes gene_type:complete